MTAFVTANTTWSCSDRPGRRTMVNGSTNVLVTLVHLIQQAQLLNRDTQPLSNCTRRRHRRRIEDTKNRRRSSQSGQSPRPWFATFDSRETSLDPKQRASLDVRLASACPSCFGSSSILRSSSTLQSARAARQRLSFEESYFFSVTFGMGHICRTTLANRR